MSQRQRAKAKKPGGNDTPPRIDPALMQAIQSDQAPPGTMLLMPVELRMAILQLLGHPETHAPTAMTIQIVGALGVLQPAPQEEK